MKIPPADEDRKEFMEKFTYPLGDASVDPLVPYSLRDEIEPRKVWQWIESKRREWIEYGYQMGKENAFEDAKSDLLDKINKKLGEC